MPRILNSTTINGETAATESQLPIGTDGDTSDNLGRLLEITFSDSDTIIDFRFENATKTIEIPIP